MGNIATKGRFLDHLLLFLLVLLVIILPFGAVIALNIGKYYGFSINIGKNRGFYGNFSEKRSENSHLSQNVVVSDICKRTNFRHLPQLLQQLILKYMSKLSTIYSICTACILANKLAPNVQLLNQCKIEPYVFKKGV
jgi:hypothetical protein